MRSWLRSLTGRVLTVPLVTAVLLLTGALILLLGPYRRQTLRDAGASAESYLRVVVAQLVSLDDRRAVLETYRSGVAAGGMLLLMTDEGTVVFDSRTGWNGAIDPATVPWPSASSTSAPRRARVVRQAGGEFLRSEYRWEGPAVGDGAALVHLTPIGALESRLERLALAIGIFWAAGTGAMLVSLAALARGLGRDRREILRVLDRLPGDVPPPTGQEEVLGLDRSVRDMARRVEDLTASLQTEIRERDAVLRDMHEGVVAVNARREVVLINPAAERMLGLLPGTGRGVRVTQLVRSGAFQSLVESVLDREGVVESEIDLEGGARRLRALGDVLRGTDGVAQGAVLVMGDVTEVRRLERIRRDFVANVSHELKTPITAIQGYVDTMLEGDQDLDLSVRRRFLAIVSSNVHRMHRILEDLLQLSRVESVGEDIDRTWIDPRVLARRALADARPEGERRSIRFDLDASLAPDRILASETLLERAIGNLLDNAVKYGPEGSTVTLRIRTEHPAPEDAPTVPMVRFEVRDEGPGIPAPHQQRLFERFYRVDKGRSRELGGTGLGLAIVKHIAIAHGGSVGVESIVGSGSTFYVTIPRGRE